MLPWFIAGVEAEPGTASTVAGKEVASVMPFAESSFPQAAHNNAAAAALDMAKNFRLLIGSF